MDAPAIATELAQLLSRGDRRAAGTLLVRWHASDVYACCRAMVKDASLAEDLSQDVFSRAFASLDEFRGEASPRTWLLRIARNRCLDHLKSARRAPWSGHEEPEPDAHADDAPLALDVLTSREDARRGLDALSETERALVVLHFGHGVGYAELADAFALKEGAVRMRVSRALARMREVIGAERAAYSSSMAAPAAATPDEIAAAEPRGEGLWSRLRRAVGGAPSEKPAPAPPPRREAPTAPAAPARPAASPAPARPAAPPAPARPAAPPAPARPAAPPMPSAAPAGPSPAMPSPAMGAPPMGAPPPMPAAPPFASSRTGAAPTPLHDSAPPSLLARLAQALDAIA